MESIEFLPTGLTADGFTALDKLHIKNNLTLPLVSCPALVNASDVQIVDNPGILNVSLPALKSYTGVTNLHLFVARNLALTEINLNSLVSSSSAANFSSNPSLTSLLLDALVFVRGSITVYDDEALVTLSLPSVVSIASAVFSSFYANDCTSLANVSFPKYLPTNGRAHRFNNCALTQESVDHILSRLVASANYVSGLVDLSGGTSSAPGAQGQTDKATLIARGCTVLTN